MPYVFGSTCSCSNQFRSEAPYLGRKLRLHSRDEYSILTKIGRYQRIQKIKAGRELQRTPKALEQTNLRKYTDANQTPTMVRQRTRTKNHPDAHNGVPTNHMPISLKGRQFQTTAIFQAHTKTVGDSVCFAKYCSR